MEYAVSQSRYGISATELKYESVYPKTAVNRYVLCVQPTIDDICSVEFCRVLCHLALGVLDGYLC